MREKFWFGIGTGFIVMLILSLIIPQICAVVGALIAGIIVTGQTIESVKAGVIIGILGMAMTMATYFLNLVTFFGGLWGTLLQIATPSILISIFVFFIPSLPVQSHNL